MWLIYWSVDSFVRFIHVFKTTKENLLYSSGGYGTRTCKVNFRASCVRKRSNTCKRIKMRHLVIIHVNLCLLTVCLRLIKQQYKFKITHCSWVNDICSFNKKQRKVNSYSEDYALLFYIWLFIFEWTELNYELNSWDLHKKQKKEIIYCICPLLFLLLIV